MPCCCTKTYRVCDVITCDGEDLVLPIPIPADGEYVLELDILGNVLKKTSTLSMGDNATFDKVDLNEKYTYVGQIIQETGEPLTFEKDGKTYDCFEFTTKRAV